MDQKKEYIDEGHINGTQYYTKEKALKAKSAEKTETVKTEKNVDTVDRDLVKREKEFEAKKEQER